eukprot:s772_g27.t1
MASSSTHSAEGPGGSLRYFSGESEDPLEFRRWKAWVSNKLLTLDKLPKEAYGSYIYTLLSGKALECVEHLEPTEYQKLDGDKVLWKLLDGRFPQKETTDILGEILGEVFNLRAKQNETLKAWIARASELFDRCERKTNVTFPQQARGWILLHRAGLTEEQKAVILARSHGQMEREKIAVAMRSCYPDMVCKTAKPAAVHLVESSLDPDDEGSAEEPLDEVDFQDVELLLSDHMSGVTGVDQSGEVFLETDVAEVMAVSWKEKRAELSKLQKSRKFTAARDLKRSFRIEVEESKKKTRCHRCGKTGHWSRECRQPRKDLPAKSEPSKPTTGAASVHVESLDFIAYVEHHNPFPVHHVEHDRSLLELLREKNRERERLSISQQASEILLVSSPGYGVLDSGCGRTIIGSETLSAFEAMLRSAGMPSPSRKSECNSFRFGNGATELSTEVALLPCRLAGRKGVISAAIVQGQAPLLISRSALQTLKARLDFQNNQIQLFDDQVTVPLATNAAGQYVLKLIDDTVTPDVQISCQVCPDPSSSEPSTSSDVPMEALSLITDDPVTMTAKDPDLPAVPENSPEVFCWMREDWGNSHVPVSTNGGPRWDKITRRIVRNGANGKILHDEAIDPSKPRRMYHHQVLPHVSHTVTEFQHTDTDPKAQKPSVLTKHLSRQIEQQVKTCHAVTRTTPTKRRLMVIEVFSPPRFAKACEQEGFKARSIDLITGQDLSVPSTRAELEQDIRDNPPELLILCPPCTDEGGWFYLNSRKWSQLEYLRRVNQSRAFIKFCCKLFRLQTSLGGRALFEHPKGAKTWKYPEVETLLRKFYSVTCDMCQFGLQLPGHSSYIRKSTRLLLSHEDMKVLGKQCPGPSDPNHQCHDHVAGYHPSVGRVSTFAGRYTDQFVHAVLQTVPNYQKHRLQHEVLEVIEDSVPDRCWAEVLAASKDEPERSDAELKVILHKLHRNLGHPSQPDLIRILRNAQASDRAIALAKQLECPTCIDHSKPKAALPAQSQRVTQFNAQIGIDVKHLTGWKANQKIKALNIVDTASGFQRMIPFTASETSKLLWSLLQDHWFAWAGTPKKIILDPSGTNLGEPLVVPLENHGIHVRQIAAGAHYQLGKTESHGGWFNKVLEKVLTEFAPSSYEEWLECVHHSHVKNSMLQHHGVSPYQFVFGRNPDVPGDLLNEPLNIVSATASLTDAAIDRANKIRASAREAVIRLQDDRALRLALAARPRVSEDFQPGALVSYWRNQKWVQGKLMLGGRWYGTAIVLGRVGRNYVLAHRKQILRAAPEQVRAATTEEATVLKTPDAELLGIKDLIEGGAFKSQQYLDLTQQSYPACQASERAAEPEAIDEAPDVPMPEVSSPPHVPEDVPPLVTPVEPHDESMPPAPASANPALTLSSLDQTVNVEEIQSKLDKSPEESTLTYGPVRSRITGKNGPDALWRPPAMRQDDFVAIMKEVTPQLITKLIDQSSTDANASQSSSVASKRGHDDVVTNPSDEPATSRQRTSSPHAEVLSVEWLDSCETIEILNAEYLKHKASKEIPHSNNAPEIQKKVDLGKRLEWETMINKPNVVKVHYGKQADRIRKEQSHRFIGSRFVLTRKPHEEGQVVDPADPSTYTVKGRWCLQGHLDPDLQMKAEEGKLQSPTLNQLSRMVLMQTISSFGWDLQLGDIKSAFLEAGLLDDKYHPLYAKQPPGGIPGLPENAVIEVLGNIYGQNDAPSAWFNTFCHEAKQAGWVQSRFDSCLFTLRSTKDQSLIGVLGIHVDDTALGGQGAEFEAAVQKLRDRFPFRKWRIGSGEFCGAFYQQCKTTKTISMNMKSCAEKLRPANIKKGISPDTPLDVMQTRTLRGINGSLNWLATQSRPDISAQTSISQQAFPHPKIKHLRHANNVVRRARMHSDLAVKFRPINPKTLTVVCHSDAAFANMGEHTQAGHIIAFTDSSLQDGHIAPWCPITWRSHKMTRAVSSTLAAESQSMATASGTVEWIMLVLSEVLDGPFAMRDCRTKLCSRKPILVTDCKSLYDHLMSPSAPTAIEDRRTSIDVAIIRESIRSLEAFVRWVPTDRMLADALTKDQGDPLDMLRSCMKSSEYQISPEDHILRMQAKEREERLCKKKESCPNN